MGKTEGGDRRKGDETEEEDYRAWTETQRAAEQQERNNNGTIRSKGTSWREVKKNGAELRLIRSGLNQNALPVALGNPRRQTRDNSIMAPAASG